MTNRTGGARASRPLASGAWERLGELFPEVRVRYEDLTAAARRAGPLDDPTAALVKLAVSVGRGTWRGVHAHARKALATGVPPDVLRHLAPLAIPVIGLAAALDALRWIDETIEEQAGNTPPARPAPRRRRRVGR